MYNSEIYNLMAALVIPVAQGFLHRNYSLSASGQSFTQNPMSKTKNFLQSGNRVMLVN